MLDAFRAPACAWCEGNRGIEYATTSGSTVGAAAAGEVTYAGRVAGVSYVVVRTAHGVLVTHGGLAAIGVRAGERREVGEAIGAAGETLYIGVRVGGTYVDPQRCSLGGVRPRPRAVLVGR